MKLQRIYLEGDRTINDEILEIPDTSLIGLMFEGNAQEVSILTTQGDRAIWRRTQ